MTVPLFQSSRPVAPSSAYSTPPAAAEPRVPPARASPVESANTTPPTTTGGDGATRSRETQAGRNAGRPDSSTTSKAASAPFLTSPLPAPNPAADAPPDGAATQRRPARSCHVATEPVSN